MITVEIHPLPQLYRAIPPRWRPGHPPIFVGEGEPTPADRELALELWRALDAESRRWYTYGGRAREFVGLPLTADDLAGLEP